VVCQFTAPSFIRFLRFWRLPTFSPSNLLAFQPSRLPTFSPSASRAAVSRFLRSHTCRAVNNLTSRPGSEASHIPIPVVLSITSPGGYLLDFHLVGTLPASNTCCATNPCGHPLTWNFSHLEPLSPGTSLTWSLSYAGLLGGSHYSPGQDGPKETDCWAADGKVSCSMSHMSAANHCNQ
jgi:hypothetical protein